MHLEMVVLTNEINQVLAGCRNIVSAQSSFDLAEHQLSTRQKDILNILINGTKMTVSEIAEKLENAPATRTVGDDLAYLKSIKLIDLEGFGRGSKWFWSKPNE